MRIRDRELHTGEPARDQAAQKREPAGTVLAGHDLEPEHFALACGVHPDGDQDRHVHRAPPVPAAQGHGVEPDVRVRSAVERPFPEARDRRIQALRQLRHLRFREPRDPQRLHQVLDFPRRHAEHIALGHHGDESALGSPARLEQPAREVRALTQLRDRQVNRPEPRVPGPRPVPVARIHPLWRSLAVAGAAQPFDVHGHELGHRVRQDLAQHIGRCRLQQLVQRLNSRHPLLGHRLLLRSLVGERVRGRCRDGLRLSSRRYRASYTTSADTNPTWRS